jgi:hypothetical protein
MRRYTKATKYLELTSEKRHCLSQQPRSQTNIVLLIIIQTTALLKSNSESPSVFTSLHNHFKIHFPCNRLSGVTAYTHACSESSNKATVQIPPCTP